MYRIFECCYSTEKYGTFNRKHKVDGGLLYISSVYRVLCNYNFGLQIYQVEGAAASVLMIKVEFRMEEAYDCHNNCTTTKPIYSLDFVCNFDHPACSHSSTYLNIIAFRALQARHAGLSGLVVLSPCAVH